MLNSFLLFISGFLNSKEHHLSEIEGFCDIKHYPSKVWGQ